MPVPAAFLKVLFASTFFSPGFFVSGNRLKQQKTATFMDVQASGKEYTLFVNGFYCNGDWNIDRKRLESVNATRSVRGCADAVAADKRCSNSFYYKMKPGYAGKCVCVMLGKECQIRADIHCALYYWGQDASKSVTSKMLWGDPANAEFTDATILAADRRSFAVHRAVLAAASPVFQKAFSVPMREAEARQIEIIDASAEATESMLAFIYSGELDESRAVAVLPLAHRYQLAELADACIASMVSSINGNNIVATVQALRPLVDSLPSAKEAWKQVHQLAAKEYDLLEKLLLHV